MEDIRVLIVDDEELVRKSLLRLVPWSEHQMKVIGEATNGRAALDFLRTNKVDLLFLDIAMPIMDGFEVLRICEKEFPRLVKVVLTCHEEPEYYRQSMRMGTVDYLCKTHFTFEQMDELLKFLAEKVSIQRRGNRIACYQERGTDWLEGWLAKRQFSFRKLSPHLLLIQEGFRVDELLPDAQDQKITLFRLYEADAQTLALYPGWIDQYVDCILFYEPVPLSREYDLYGWQVGMELTESDEEELAREITDGQWLVYGQQIQSLLEKLPKHRFSGKRLRFIVSQMRSDLAGLLSEQEAVPASLSEVDYPTLRNAMEQLHTAVGNCMRNQGEGISEQVLLAILRAVHLVRDRQYIAANQEKVPRLVGVSRSYFSRCFKRITGVSFSDFQRKERLLYANDLLEKTDMPVYAIAQACNFEDERYFGRVYHAYMHQHPMEYRNQRKKQ